MATFLAETPFEDGAQDEHGAIFREIASLTGVGGPALLFRTLSTLPGVLEWSWGLLRPLAISGRLQETAWALAREVEPLPAPAIMPEALRVSGIDEAAAREIRTIIAAFNRANPFNLICAGILRLVMERGAEESGGEASSHRNGWTPPATLKPSVPAIRPQDMDPDTLALVMALGCRDRRDGEPMLVPTLYRHLARWPGYLALASLIVPPAFESGEVGRRIDALRARAGEETAGFAAEARQSAPRPDADALGETARTLERFSHKIPEMVVVGRLLADTLPTGD